MLFELLFQSNLHSVVKPQEMIYLKIEYILMKFEITNLNYYAGSI